MLVKKSELKLIPDSDPILRRVPEPYDFAKHGGTAEIFANVLYEKMQEYKGVGLSANQLGIPVSVFVIGFEEVRMDVFNPRIVTTYGESDYNEGCLSYLGIFVDVKRPEKIDVEYYNAKGELQQKTFTGLTARIFQHEYDHMLGKTIKDQVSGLKWALAVKKRKKSRSVA